MTPAVTAAAGYEQRLQHRVMDTMQIQGMERQWQTEGRCCGHAASKVAVKQTRSNWGREGPSKQELASA